MRKILIVIIILGWSGNTLFSQDSLEWKVLLLKKGREYKEKEELFDFSSSGFYLCENCIYNLQIDSGEYINGRLTDVKLDTLFFTHFFNETAAFRAEENLDTIAYHYSKLKQISLISDRSLGLRETHSLRKFDFIFKKDSAGYFLPSRWEKIFKNDNKLYEIVPHLTAQGIGFLFEENGKTYYFYGGGMTKPDAAKRDTRFIKRNVIGFTPANVDEINGLSLSFYTINTKNAQHGEENHLTVNGLNVGLNPFVIFFIILDPFADAVNSDNIQYYHEKIKDKSRTTINGVNLGISSFMLGAKINGFSLAVGKTLAYKIEGVTISGVSNFAYKIQGVSLSSIHNRATILEGVQIGAVNLNAKMNGVQLGVFNRSRQMRGLQIGLINISQQTKGLQIGLWNKNAKRSLPFVNW